MPLSSMANTTRFKISPICFTVIPMYEIHWIGKAYGFFDRHSVLIITARICVAAACLFLYNPNMGTNTTIVKVGLNHVKQYALLYTPFNCSVTFYELFKPFLKFG